MSKKEEEMPKIKPIEIKPLEELKGFEEAGQEGFVCDFETGICGPANQEKEAK